MIPLSNPLGVGWVERTDYDDPDVIIDILRAGPYRAVEAPACGIVLDLDPAATTDQTARRFICDRPAGHDDGYHRHIYTDLDETARDFCAGHAEEAVWWSAFTWVDDGGGGRLAFRRSERL